MKSNKLHSNSKHRPKSINKKVIESLQPPIKKSIKVSFSRNRLKWQGKFWPQCPVKQPIKIMTNLLSGSHIGTHKKFHRHQETIISPKSNKSIWRMWHLENKWNRLPQLQYQIKLLQVAKIKVLKHLKENKTWKRMLTRKLNSFNHNSKY